MNNGQTPTVDPTLVIGKLMDKVSQLTLELATAYAYIEQIRREQETYQPLIPEEGERAGSGA